MVRLRHLIGVLLLAALVGCAGSSPSHYSPYVRDDNSILRADHASGM
jgi:hypothetical protein